MVRDTDEFKVPNSTEKLNTFKNLHRPPEEIHLKFIKTMYFPGTVHSKNNLCVLSGPHCVLNHGPKVSTPPVDIEPNAYLDYLLNFRKYENSLTSLPWTYSEKIN